MSNGTGRVAGKVAFITGIARGQGRSHAVRLAEEGADIIGLDICGPIDNMTPPASSETDMAETVAAVEALDRRIVARRADVRDQGAIDGVVTEGIAELGHIDIVSANAGTLSYGKVWEMSEEEWSTNIDINLSGVWRTAKAVLPAMIERGEGGSLIFTGSAGAIKGYQNLPHYIAGKHGIVGLTRALCQEVGEFNIRVNCMCPGNTNTLLLKDSLEKVFGDPKEGEVEGIMAALNPMGVPWVEPSDLSNALLWLASDESRYVTGAVLSVDAGFTTM